MAIAKRLLVSILDWDVRQDSGVQLWLADIPMACNATLVYGFRASPSAPAHAFYILSGGIPACDHSVQDPPSPRPFPPNPPPSPA
ncbi:hypothetical protein N7475_001428 [Penicillium sp. IBT 31633x]|nr:hypothetical protein N7475_001428 [Penicillium sp. IBT 31633x]